MLFLLSNELLKANFSCFYFSHEKKGGGVKTRSLPSWTGPCLTTLFQISDSNKSSSGWDCHQRWFFHGIPCRGNYSCIYRSICNEQNGRAKPCKFEQRSGLQGWRNQWKETGNYKHTEHSKVPKHFDKQIYSRVQGERGLGGSTHFFFTEDVTTLIPKSHFSEYIITLCHSIAGLFKHVRNIRYLYIIQNTLNKWN